MEDTVFCIYFRGAQVAFIFKGSVHSMITPTSFKPSISSAIS